MTAAELTRRIRTARAYAGLTQDDVASKLDMPTITYKRAEQGRREPTVVDVVAISKATGVAIEFFTHDLADLFPPRRA